MISLKINRPLLRSTPFLIGFFLGMFLFICNVGVAQTNLVPNPSFEDTVSCPWAESQMPLDWLLFGNSADFLHECSSALNIPNTPTGYHQANSGGGMIGVYNYVDSMSSGWPDYREFVGVQLKNPLSIGQKYYLSFYFSYGKTYSFGCNCNGIGSDKLGMKFSTMQYSQHNPPELNNSAHLYTDSIYIDTAQWVKVSGSIIADSAYSYLMVGNFFDEIHTNSQHFGGPPFFTFGSYYFIDDICVTTDSLFNENWVGVEDFSRMNFGNAFSVFQNPANSLVTINSSLQSAFNIEIFNVAGQLLYSEQKITDKILQLDISAYNRGLLFIKITSFNDHFTYKLLKQ